MTLPQTTKRRARDLMPGDIVLGHIVSDVEWLDGESGKSLSLIGGDRQKTAVAMRIHYNDGRSVIVHPSTEAPETVPIRAVH